MRVIEIVCSRTCKVNVGDYQSVDLFLSGRAELDELDDPGEAWDALHRQLDRAMLEQLVRLQVNRQPGKAPDKAAIARRFGLQYDEEF